MPRSAPFLMPSVGRAPQRPSAQYWNWYLFGWVRESLAGALGMMLAGDAAHISEARCGAPNWLTGTKANTEILTRWVRMTRGWKGIMRHPVEASGKRYTCGGPRG